MRKILFILVVCSIYLVSCESELTFNELRINAGIKFHNTEPSTVFRNVPVEFYCSLDDTSKSFPDFDVTWDLDNGNYSYERSFYYSYSQNGVYNPKIKINDGKETFILGDSEYDFNFKVNDYPSIIGIEGINEIGKYIFTNGNDYDIIYLSKSADKETELRLKIVDQFFNEQSDVKLDVEIPIDIKTSFKNNEGNIIIISESSFYKFSISGDLIKKVDKKREYESVVNISNSYKAVSIENNLIRSDSLDQDFNIVNSRLIDWKDNEGGYFNNIDDYNLINVFLFESGDYIASSSIDSLNDSNILTYFNADGVIQSQYIDAIGLIEKVFNTADKRYIIVQEELNNVNVYSILYGYADMEHIRFYYEQYYFYTLKDSELKHSFQLLIDYNDNGILLFYDDMHVKSFDSYSFNNVFGFDDDVFSCAVKNSEGNYIILGTKQNTSSGLTMDSDLLLIEIDENGNSVVK